MSLGTDGPGPYVTYPRAPEPAPPPPPPEASTTKATWAFALGLIPTPFTLPVAFGLGISVLNAGRDGRDHGRKRAIAAILLASFWALVVFTVLYGWAMTKLDDASVAQGGDRTTTQGLVYVQDLVEGDCLGDDRFTKLEVTRIEVVPCSEPHRAEVFSRFTLDGGDYPGDDETIRLSEDGCLERLEEVVGMTWDEMPFGMSYYSPEELTWDYDRSVLCIAVLPEKQSGTLDDLAADEVSSAA